MMQMTGKTPPRSRKKKEVPQERQNFTMAILDRLQTPVVIVDSKTHVIRNVNPRAAELLGRSKEQLTGSTCHDTICPEKTGSCPVTDRHMSVTNAACELILADGKRINVKKTVAEVTLDGRPCLVESFEDLTDHLQAEDRKVIMIGFLSESMHRVRRPLELTKMNLQVIADQVKSGEYDNEEIRMELQIQANNIGQMIQNLEELARSVTGETLEVSPEYRKFILGK